MSGGVTSILFRARAEPPRIQFASDAYVYRMKKIFFSSRSGAAMAAPAATAPTPLKYYLIIVILSFNTTPISTFCATFFSEI